MIKTLPWVTPRKHQRENGTDGAENSGGKNIFEVAHVGKS